MLLTVTIIQPALSRESGGHKFWYGNGGKVVLIASIYGLYYWLYEYDETEVVSPNGFSLYLKPNQTQINFQNWNHSAGLKEEYLNLKYDFLISQPIKSYGFIGVNREISFIGQAGMLAKQVDVYGLGFSYSNNNQSKISLEFSKLSSYDEFNNESIKLEYSLSF
ncbi:MAG: hypothetical protein COB38_10210 [Gammaproteobacteria bacterium]|nr:MAG: hypothetical protein COB38_10210 [Gammaproteobacteria bacterium]